MKDTFLSRFTPSLMSHETLEAIFIQRERLATDLVERARDSVLTDSKHHTLLIGPRGIGKTHLVALVYHRVKELEELRDQLCIAWLREEEWGITSFMDLLLRILRALEEEQPDADLARAIEAIYELSSRDEAERAAVGLLKSHVGNRTLLILMENLGDVFDGLGQEGQQQLRAFLQNNVFATIMATSQSLFGGVSVKTSPFYGFFNVHHLKPFDFDDATDLLATLARLDGDDELAEFIQTPKGRARIRAVHHLAGGNPRVYVILSQFLTRDALDALVEPFMSMLDDMTPYYQARMQWLSPQQRKIVEYLIERRHAVPVKDIAQHAFTSHQSISSQLRSLRKMGYVRSISVGRESLYELREPLMRMCVEVKKHRGQPIQLFVDFLRLWYTRDEMKRRLTLNTSDGDVEQQYLREALALVKEPQEPPFLEPCRQDFERHTLAGDYEQALQVAEEMVAIEESALAYYAKGISLLHLNRTQEAIISLRRATNLQPRDLELWYSLVEAQARSNDWRACIDSLEDAIKSLDGSDDADAPHDGEIVDAVGLVLNMLFSACPNETMLADYAANLVRVFCDNGALSSLGVALIRSMERSDVGAEAAVRWFSVWERAGKQFGQLRIPLLVLERRARIRSKDAVVRFAKQGDMRFLLELPAEERELLQQILDIAHTGDA